jgi:hypothetical protein
VEIYELSVGQPGSDTEGFVLASNDARIGNILAIAEGSLEEATEEFATVLNVNLQEYVDATIMEYNSITEAEIEAALEKAIAEKMEGSRALSNHWNSFDFTGNWVAYSYTSDFSIAKTPLLNTKWGQGTTGAYSANNYVYNNYVKSAKGYNYYVTGCGPTAIAQIIAYHNYIKPVASYRPAAFETLGYTITNYANATSLSETLNSSTISYITTPATIKSALNNNRPIYTRGAPTAGTGGHAWVIDGHGAMTTYREYFYNTQTGQTSSVSITLTNCLMVHCNMGWNGNANSWYIYGIFDTANRTLLESSSGSGGNYSANTMILVPRRP